MKVLSGRKMHHREFLKPQKPRPQLLSALFTINWKLCPQMCKTTKNICVTFGSNWDLLLHWTKCNNTTTRNQHLLAYSKKGLNVAGHLTWTWLENGMITESIHPFLGCGFCEISAAVNDINMLCTFFFRTLSHGLSSIWNLFPLCLLLKPSAIALLCFIFMFSINHLILCMFILFLSWVRVCLRVCVTALVIPVKHFWLHLCLK